MAAPSPASSVEPPSIVIKNLRPGCGADVLCGDGGNSTLPTSRDPGSLRSRERRNLVKLKLECLEMLPCEDRHADQIGRNDRDGCCQAQHGDDASAHSPNQSRMFPTLLPYVAEIPLPLETPSSTAAQLLDTLTPPPNPRCAIVPVTVTPVSKSSTALSLSSDRPT